MIVPLEPHGPRHRPDLVIGVPTEERLCGSEIGVSLEPAGTGQRLPMPNRLVWLPALRTRLTRPCLGLLLYLDPIFLTDGPQLVDELLERPEVLQFLVDFRGRLDFDDAGEIADVHRCDPFVVQPFDEVTDEGVLGVGPSAGAFSVKPADTLARVLPWRQLGRQGRDLFGRRSELFEQLFTVVEVLIPRCGRTRNEVVGTQIEGGFFRSQW